MPQAEVLIIDNNQAACEIYSDTLKSAGYKVCTICDEEVAISHLQKNVPDVVLLDILMPKISGLHILESIKRDPKTSKINVVILTELSDPETKKKAHNKGAEIYLVKSEINMTDLLKAVDKSLSK